MSEQQKSPPIHGLPEWMFGGVFVGIALVTLHAYRMRHLDGYLASATFLVRSALILGIAIGIYYAWERIARFRRGRSS